MNTTKRLILAASLFGLVLTASGTARAADWVRIVGFNPASPASLSGCPTGSPMAAGNSVEVVFTYNLETHATARIGFYTAGEAGNTPAIHTGLNLPFMVTKKGEGKGTTRFSVQCNGKYDSAHIVNLRYDMFFDPPVPGAPLVKLFEDHKTVDFTFKCPPTTHPNDPTPTFTPNPNNPTHGPTGRKPNITFARKGIYIWGANPATKKWVDFGTAVNLKAADAIDPHPTPSNGRCAFNVEYYEKETNGVATGPFKNKIYSDADVRAINGPWSLAASQVTSRTTQPYLDAGAHGLKVVLDADLNQAETNEADNANSIRYILDGRCTAPAAAGVPKK